MSGVGNVIVRSATTDGRLALAELVMAWARDAATGEPRYILELGPDRRGAKCACECPSCGLALTAVNAAKDAFIRRPHFRHPEGAERADCLLLAARAAAMRQFQDDGWLTLPRRRKSAQVAGLSGHFYEAWVERPAERLRIRDVDYRDRAVALVTFDDGRQLRVVLTGTPGGADAVLDEHGLPVPTILVDVGDPGLAGMPPAELRRRLTLLPEGLCWRTHWNDHELHAEAEAAARAEAHFYFDDDSEKIEFPADLDPALRRETVLHHEVKRILDDERRLTVPGIEVEVNTPSVNGKTLHGRWAVDAESLVLDLVELEQRLGRIIPDITCKAWPSDGGEVFWPFLVEVTVTNTIDDERLARIRTTGEAALEIDLSLAGGRVTRAELHRLVVDEIATKRWLHHPTAERQRAALLATLTAQAAQEHAELRAREQAIEERRRRVLEVPIADLASEYLDAVLALVDAGAAEDADGKQPVAAKAAELEARESVADAVDKLAIRGYPEAADQNLIGYHGILAKLLSIRLDRPVGYRVENVMGVLNAIRNLSPPSSSTASLYLIAVRAYGPQLPPDHWFEQWAANVKVSLRRREDTYRRDPAYDRLLSLLFPEMAAGLAKRGAIASPERLEPTNSPHANWREKLPERRRAGFLSDQPAAHRDHGRLLDTRPGDWWLKGRDLEAWKKANPEEGRAWFGAPPASDS